LFDFGSVLSIALSFLIAFAPLEGAVVYVLRFYLPRYLDKKFEQGVEQIESIVYGLFTPTEEAIIENGVIVQPKGTVPIVAALTPLSATILIGLGELFKQLPGVIGSQIGEEIKKGLISVKMGGLGAIGNAAKSLGAVADDALAAKDPALAVVKPVLGQWVAENFGKKAGGGVEVALGMLPVNLTDILTGPVLSKLAEKYPIAKQLVEELKAANVVQNAEKIV